MNKELAEFRKKVVKEALEAAEKFDWCNEVYSVLDKMGLEDLLPPVYNIEIRQTARSRKWKIFCDGYRDLDEVTGDVVNQRRNQTGWRGSFPSQSLYINVSEMTPETAQIRVNEAYAAWEAHSRLKTELNPYPLFRVVNAKTGEIVLSEDEVNTKAEESLRAWNY